MKAYDTLVIHHSASRRNTRVATVRKWHTDPKPRGNGWSDVGYHWLIDQTGKLHVGRPIQKTGAHAPPNSGRIGVCVIGDNTKANQSWNQAQCETLASVIAAMELLFPGIKVCGHRDVMRPGYTECPGVDIETLVK